LLPAVLQANAVSDKLLDLRKCKLPGANLSGKTLSGGIFVDADLSGSNLREAVFSKAYAVKSNFKGGSHSGRTSASLRACPWFTSLPYEKPVQVVCWQA
jgi:uncharacterized protein YjbI with pentapeptide repeats